MANDPPFSHSPMVAPLVRHTCMLLPRTHSRASPVRRQESSPCSALACQTRGTAQPLRITVSSFSQQYSSWSTKAHRSVRKTSCAVVEVIRNAVRLKDRKVWNLKRVALCGKESEENKECDYKNYVWMEDNVDVEGKLDVEEGRLEMIELNVGGQPETSVEGQSMKDTNTIKNVGEMRKGNVVHEALEEHEELLESDRDVVGVKRKRVLPGWLKDFVIL
ncbi:hypothetical protein NDU88_003642 [Pleurodeles waltl]|uniref:Uncharacterized protein n=1 Tax=Pleurodeles waltl TaxID=8319 RepID=A0AAV7TPK5_PLEWA|nr:hypothetical protein NDU88_003642 [Pleurodeles waltl]